MEHEGGEGRQGERRPTERATQATKAVQQDFNRLISTVQDSTNELTSLLREQMARRPYATIAAAAGTGWILGGGLATRFTGLLMAAGARAALASGMSAVLSGARRMPREGW